MGPLQVRTGDSNHFLSYLNIAFSRIVNERGDSDILHGVQEGLGFLAFLFPLCMAGMRCGTLFASVCPTTCKRMSDFPTVQVPVCAGYQTLQLPDGV